jgi:hypothetical protein
MYRLNRQFFILFLSLVCCGQAAKKSPVESGSVNYTATTLINPAGTCIQNRFNTPSNFHRIPAEPGTFQEYLRNLPLKPHGSKVKYFNGIIKENICYDAVVDLDIGKKDLLQCADAVMLLRAEYFYSRKEFDKISFALTNGFKVDYSEWQKGNRIIAEGNKTYWKHIAAPSEDYKGFRSYMDLIFTYAGTLSLSKSLTSKSVSDINIGDIFIVGGSPGHAIIVTDMAVNDAGEKIFLLTQSYMPAQEIHILKNPTDEKISPWYSANIIGHLHTPEWTFATDELKTW